MKVFSEEMLSGDGMLRIDVVGGEGREHVLEEMTFLNYRLADVKLRSEVRKQKPDIVWDVEASKKAIRYDGVRLTLDGTWEQGELNKIVVSMLALEMEKVGLHPFHSSSVRYRDKTILFLGGESNHGKSMSQIEGCRRGGLLVSTETTVTDDRGWAVMGSKNVYLRMRAKGTERADLPNQDEGVSKFFSENPPYINYSDPTNIDLVIMPGIDGHFDTKVVEMNRFEREYQTFHSLMNYFGLNQLLSPPGIVMPIIDTDALRAKRGDFCSRFAADRPYFMIRAKTPQLLFDEIEKLM
ncbi:MAG: hypothetical protein ABFC85_11375 [Rectinema sp.]|jgi:hypothetical protein|uniref:Uncharacterized protein n=1 Tax=uncultured spirochete TaxID=156406 RepID=A0A3P3XN30_9SPIR|nr:conserved hypothetical protein [uncultured spirochete]